MKTEDTYDLSISMIATLGANVEETAGASDFSSFLRIRKELNHFLINLNHSNRADGAGQQIHFLFMALDHLENVDKEIRVSGADHDLRSLEMIHDKIRSLKLLILNYIKQITADD